jgi:hypothetical protein
MKNYKKSVFGAACRMLKVFLNYPSIWCDKAQKLRDNH